MGRLLFLALLGLASAQYTCPAQKGAYAICSTTVLYIIDTSTDLTDAQIRDEFDWIRFNILPGTAWSTNQKIALISYGTGNVNSFVPTGSLSSACGQLDSLEVSYSSVGSNAATLYTTLQTVELYYGSSVTTMILFTGSKNSADISQAADYIRQHMAGKAFTVIALNNNAAYFNGFPASTVYDVPNIKNAPPNLAPCILKKACEQTVYSLGVAVGGCANGACDADTCDINGPPASTIGPYTTVNPCESRGLARSDRLAVESDDYYDYSTHSPCGPSPTAATSIKCQCNPHSVWVDLIFLIDASASTGEDGLDAMWNSAATLLGSMNVQKNGYTGTNYYTKVGVVTYGDTAKAVYPLGSIDNNDIDGIFSLPYNGDKTTNLEAAIQVAMQQFNGPSHRPNARRVMFTMAAVYDPDGVTAPQKAATTFKEADGVMIVYNFFPEGGIESSTLKEISSPGYYFSSVLNSQLDEMEVALCDANCFCPKQQRVYTEDSPRNTPSDGCYMEVKTQTSYARAQNICRVQYNNATVTLDETADKTAFLQSMFSPPTTAFFIGLTYDSIDRAWEWPDGTPLGSYQPWASGTAHDGQNGLQCVYINAQGLWQPADCRNGYYYVCQMIPCDSVHYCAN